MPLGSNEEINSEFNDWKERCRRFPEYFAIGSPISVTAGEERGGGNMLIFVVKYFFDGTMGRSNAISWAAQLRALFPSGQSGTCSQFTNLSQLVIPSTVYRV